MVVVVPRLVGRDMIVAGTALAVARRSLTRWIVGWRRRFGRLRRAGLTATIARGRLRRRLPVYCTFRGIARAAAAPRERRLHEQNDHRREFGGSVHCTTLAEAPHRRLGRRRVLL